MEDFNPDEYLKSKPSFTPKPLTTSTNDFDPDEYLKASIPTSQTPVEQPSMLDKAKEYRKDPFGSQGKEMSPLVKTGLEFTPISPVVIGIDAYEKARESGLSHIDAIKNGVQSGAIDAGIMLTTGGIGKVAGKIGLKGAAKDIAEKGAIDKGSRWMASLFALGKNAPVKKYVQENPEAIINPKLKGADDWQKTYTNVFDYFKKKKDDIGRNIGILKKEATTQGKDISINKNEIIKDINDTKNSMAFTAKSERANMDELIGAVNKVKPTKVTVTRNKMGIPEKTIYDNPTLDLEDAFEVVKNIDNLQIMKDIYKKQADRVKISDGERLLLEFRGKYIDNLNTKLDQIEGTGEELIKAKKDYTNLMKLNKQLGDLTLGNTPKKLRNSLKIDEEYDFQALKEFLPDPLLKNTVSHVLNESVGHTPVERFIGNTAKVVVGSVPYIGAGVAKAVEKPIVKTALSSYMGALGGNINTQLQ